MRFWKANDILRLYSVKEATLNQDLSFPEWNHVRIFRLLFITHIAVHFSFKVKPKGTLFWKELLNVSQGNVLGRNFDSVRHWFPFFMTKGVNCHCKFSWSLFGHYWLPECVCLGWWWHGQAGPQPSLGLGLELCLVVQALLLVSRLGVVASPAC